MVKIKAVNLTYFIFLSVVTIIVIITLNLVIISITRDRGFVEHMISWRPMLYDIVCERTSRACAARIPQRWRLHLTAVAPVVG